MVRNGGRVVEAGNMNVDALDLLRRGGPTALRLLDYSVYSVRLDLVFAFLVTEYRVRPTAVRALALYDGFCAPGAPGRVRAEAVLPPRHLSLAGAIERVRRSVADAEHGVTDGLETPKPVPIPPRDLFDGVLAVVTAPDHETVQRVRDAYDPDRSPLENLPGGRMTEGQRAFVERVWRARLRPALARAGFARVSTVGG
jgi:hypothetical protein